MQLFQQAPAVLKKLHRNDLPIEILREYHPGILNLLTVVLGVRNFAETSWDDSKDQGKTKLDEDCRSADTRSWGGPLARVAVRS
ncbi:hypothetical protein N7490_010019 [Penicillium lividum]|nr:hypothetical protein N7490_010019 [Penicillium lividum]